MGFYFRKSKSFGPFRLNLSKSGLGLSTGIKGARLSFGPRGTYVNMGSSGLYYRKKLGGKKHAKRDNIYNQTQKAQYNEQTSEINISPPCLLSSAMLNATRSFKPTPPEWSTCPQPIAWRSTFPPSGRYSVCSKLYPWSHGTSVCSICWPWLPAVAGVSCAPCAGRTSAALWPLTYSAHDSA